MPLPSFLSFNKTKKLINANNDTPKFTLKGKIKKCKVVDVYDGDTCKVVFIFNKKPQKFTIRLLGYNSPEMRPSKSNPNRDAIITSAVISRDFLKNKIMNIGTMVYIKCDDFDSFGRILGTIYFENPKKKIDIISINDIMIKKGYGIEYNP